MHYTATVNQRPSFEAVSRLANGRWAEILTALGIDRSTLTRKHGPCPGCGGTDRFRFDDRDGRGTWICSQGGEITAGDGFQLLEHAFGLTRAESLQRVANLLLGDHDLPPLPAPKPRLEPVRHRWSPLAERIWRATVPLAGTAGERYLLRRRCAIPPVDGDLRFLPRHAQQPDALVARVTDFVTNEATSLHFTDLLDDGSHRKRLLKDHQKAGGVIRLWSNERVTDGLGIAEGVETALSLAHAYKPVWAAVDSANMAALPVLGGIESLLIAEDGDEAGRKASAGLGQRWANAGRDVHIIPAPPNRDLNDMIVEVAA